MVKRILTVSCFLAAFSASLFARGGGETMLYNAIGFLNKPYVAHTLERGEEEELVVNLEEVDCTTLVEYVLAASLCTQQGEGAQEEFERYLRHIRYRDGVIDGYPSRLHYIADWVENGVRGGFVEDVTSRHSSHTLPLSLDYMTAHAAAYKHLKDSPQNVARMRETEKRLSRGEFHYLPAEELPCEGLPWIEDGDMIAITTDLPGLDVTHMGIAFYVGGKLRLLHASSTQKKVVVSRASLAQMLRDNARWTGIRVLRMKR